MKKIVILNLLSSLVIAKVNLFTCENLDSAVKFSPISIFSESGKYYISTNGKNTQVKLLKKYGGRISEFHNGGTRIKVSKIRKATDGNHWARVRIPQLGITSPAWSCK